MRLIVINTGSSGNSYALVGDTSTLLVEAGMPFISVKMALNFDISKIEGVIVSHEHL